MRSSRVPRVLPLSPLLRGLCAAAVLATGVPAAASPGPASPAAQSPDDLLRRGKSIERDDPAGAQKLYEQLLDGHDGSVAAAQAVAPLLALLRARVAAATGPALELAALDRLEQRLQSLEQRASFRLPEASGARELAAELTETAAWQRGDLHVQAARAGEPDGFRRCAEHYEAFARRLPADHPRAATATYNAAQCFEAARMPDRALQLYAAVVDRFPQSEYAERSLAILAELSENIARYDDAARYMETYAGRYLKSQQTPDFLRNAYLLRLGLGQRELAATDLTRYEELYRRSDPERAAKIFWSKRELLGSDAERLRHAEQFLQVYGQAAGFDRRAVAEATIGQILWRQSCAKGLLHEACVSVRRAPEPAPKDSPKAKPASATRTGKAPALPQRCSAPAASVVTVHARDRKLADSAQRHFSEVLKVADTREKLPEDDLSRRKAFAEAVAMASVYAADQRFEEYLKVAMPEGLSFFVEEWKHNAQVPKWEKEYELQVLRKRDSERRFLDFHKQKTELAQTLQTQYERVIADRASVEWTLAATARTAQVVQNYAEQLLLAEVPREFTQKAQADAFCAALRDKAQPMQEVAVQRYARCLEFSVATGVFNDFTRLCEEELQRRDPARWPRTNELFGAPQYLESRPERAGVQLDPGPRASDL